MLNKLKELLKISNEKGIPIPMVRDHGKASVSLTLLVISSIFVILGLITKLHPIINGINFWEALAWNGTCAMLYYNRGAKISKEGIEIEASEPNSQEENE